MYGVGAAFQPSGASSSTGKSSKEKKRHDEDDEEEDDNEAKGVDAWERAYADERSWEDLQEDESGLLRPIDTKTFVHAQYRKRLLLRSSAGGSVVSRIQKGLIRYLYVVIDLSRVCSQARVFFLDYIAKSSCLLIAVSLSWLSENQW